MLFLCQNMLQTSRDQRPTADDLRLCWSYQPLSAPLMTSCKCILFPDNLEHYSTEGINETLQRASGNGYELMVCLLIGRGADVNSKGVLQKASAGGFGIIVQILLEKRTDIEVKGNNGQTALRLAARYRHEATVRLLLEKGADIEAKGNNRQTALQLAARYRHEITVRLLLKKGANMELKDNNG
ncbi:MAG: hypothetical protein M1839_003803 [Geoglossum umbratile]|nr:MAG: hypothetical protein M1839_003803 [Geoglossum umbratile]